MEITQKKHYAFMLILFYSCLGITFPASVTQFSMVVADMAKTMGVSEQTILLADSVRAVCLVMALFLSGYVHRTMGLRKTVVLGVSFQIAAQFLIPEAVHSGSVPLLFIVKGMQGLNAVAFPLYISTIASWVSPRYVGLATAVFNGSFVAGSGLGAWISGMVVPAMGWQASYYIIGGISLAFALPAIFMTKDRRDSQKKEKISQDKRPVYKAIVKNPMTWLLVLSLIANTWVSQAITVDLSVYGRTIGYTYGQIGNLMLIISSITIGSSIMGGAISDYFANRSQNSIKSRCRILAFGYIIAAVGSLALPFVGGWSFLWITAAASTAMFGVSWAAGVFWAIPSEVYSSEDQVAGTAFCSGASNIPNPIAPFVVGILLGTKGYWTLGWLTCSIVIGFSLLATLAIPRLVASGQRSSCRIKTTPERV